MYQQVLMSRSRVVPLLLAGLMLSLAGCGGGGDIEPSNANNSLTSPPPSTPANYSLSVGVSGAGAVTSTPTGISCGNTCDASYASGTSVTLVAVPASGHAFAGWSVSGVSCPATASCTIPVTQNRNVTATFVPNTFSLSIAIAGAGAVTSSPAGINCGADCNEVFTNGASVTLSATPTAGYSFSGWSGSGISCPGTGPCTVSMTEARSVTATFSPIAATTYVLQVTKSGTGTVASSPTGINCGATCSASYTSGTSVTLTATAASGQVFSGWSGGGCSGTGSCAVSMTAARTVSATFTPVTYTLTVVRSGSGTVTSAPAGISCGSTCSASYASGTAITLTATPASGYAFNGWSGACSGTSSCAVTMTGARSVTATFRDSANPTVAITSPTTGTTYVSTNATVSLAGNATDNVGVTQMSWANSLGGSGNSSASGTSTTWNFNVALTNGANVITVTARDAVGNSTNRTLTVTYTTPSANNALLSWTAPTARENGDPVSISEIGGFKIYYGTSLTSMTTVVDIPGGSTTQHTVSGLTSGLTYYFSISAYDTTGLEGPKSAAASKSFM